MALNEQLAFQRLLILAPNNTDWFKSVIKEPLNIYHIYKT